MNRSNEHPHDRSIVDGSAGSDFLQLDIGEAPSGGRADWLAGRLRRAISDGLLPLGSRLPATRVLAAELRVSRGVVTEAYQRLSEDGHVAGRGRNGTVVVAAPADTAPRPGLPRQAAPSGDVGPGNGVGRSGDAGPGNEAGIGNLFAAPPGDDIFDLIRAAPARIDLSPGVPDLTAFPRAAWLRAEREVLGGLSASGFGYGDPRGTPELRRAVVHWLARNRGIRAEPDEVIVVAGTTQALALLGQVLRAGGVEEIAVEDPGSLGVRQHLRWQGLRTPPVSVDAEGVRVDELGSHGAVLLTPAHQFPTGVVLGGARRRALMRWAGDGGLVVEDDYDAEHRYDRPPVPALRSMLPERVCYAGSVSKLLAPALRTGWVLVPARHRDTLVDAKRFADLGNAALPQLVLARLMESGELERHLRLLRRRHRRRRDAMIAAIRDRLPGAVVHGAAAGLHLLVTFEGPRIGGVGPLSDTDLAAAALARGVKVHPLSWHRQRPGPPGLLLGYAASPASVITDGVAAIGDALDDVR
ncbi:PLP-dependent aminotransferase family protein [Streptomyces sp. NBC_01340]|uniref:MocR-like pyridoxine biosynthesis transcription factor PdxR n=1 Tax=unclassified Streptomyces TaxID=2593676 RepID=UPI00224C9D9C|nr:MULTISPECIES: PLP-dependent aminotransferase family protein [unclassified Streptomyces]MCX4456237.1 PLP-dependent aminotransferase family protein [Streptomyces sp. NBC_01719]MCX4495595.1 PLP-dependent aminotransferase family protein [Streptomyces sp. NBC_01728]WSI40546.1 PLP-dependent aminotransferase family protein [Streptomyces sp. NBC_01340]